MRCREVKRRGEVIRRHEIVVVRARTGRNSGGRLGWEERGRGGAIGGVVRGGVDRPAHFDGFHLVGGIRDKQRPEFVGGQIGGIEPTLEGFAGDNDGHAIVDGLDQFVGRCGDDGEGAQLGAVGGMPGIPEAGEGECRLRFEAQEEWGFGF
jgi:hypothetical protein